MVFAHWERVHKRRRSVLRFGCHCERGPSGVLVRNVREGLPAEVYGGDGNIV